MKYIYNDLVFLKEYKDVYLQTEENFKWYFSIWLILVFLSSIPASEIVVKYNSEKAAMAFIAFVGFFSAAIMIKIHQGKKKKLLKNYGINKEEADNYYQFLSKDIVYAPLLQRVCQLNPDAKETQIEWMKKWFCLDDASISEYIFDRKYNNDEEMEEGKDKIVEKLKEEDISYIKTFINRLFQLVILEDGIHNDEWKLLMQLITDLRLNKNYIKYFKDRYNPLRTEFDESEWKGSSSSTTYALTSPKEYYDVLGLVEGASYEEIRRAYHELALQHHPDLPKNAERTEECEKMMMKINEAYEKLRIKN